MATIELGKGAIEYAAESLQDERGIAALLASKELSSPIVFGPEENVAGRYEDLHAGGVTTQHQADKELANYLRELKRSDFGLCSIFFHNPWIKIEDLRNLGPPPQEIFQLGDSVYYLYDIRDINADVLGKIRSLCISFLKLSYVSTMSVRAIRENVSDAANNEILYAQSVRHLIVSACDDETWLVCKVN